ncbi:MAG TPA: FAD-dependent oxidoreductase [Patescibacteria group bacterium]|nr:FAD-dependent oxidoreductase [Patescibacteria group bacterium]
MPKYEVIIVGGACAGLSAAIYTSRRGLNTLVLTKDIGGQMAITTEVENYPGYKSIKGPELAMKFKEQAESSGAEIKMNAVKKIEKKDNGFLVKTESEDYLADSVILAFGLKQRHLGVPNEEKLTGRGVSYCATCDGPFFKDKKVAVVGGANSAFDAADYLAELAEKVYLFVRSGKYKAEKTLIKAVKNKKNIEIKDFVEITAFKGEEKLEKVELINNKTRENSEMELDGVFIEIGWKSMIDDFVGLKDLIDVGEKGYIKTDNAGKTSCPGIFAAGDATQSPFKQAVISAGEGARAGLSVAAYLRQKKGNEDSVSLFDDSRRNKK